VEVPGYILHILNRQLSIIQKNKIKKLQKNKKLSTKGVLMMDEDIREFLTSLSSAFERATTTYQSGIGECYVMTKELGDKLIADIEELLTRS